jgi:hypothetical protein
LKKPSAGNRNQPEKGAAGEFFSKFGNKNVMARSQSRQDDERAAITQDAATTTSREKSKDEHRTC